MPTDAKPYTGAEREQIFVKKTMLNPAYNGETLLLPTGVRCDNRRFITTPQWTYCASRHRQFWRDQGYLKRAIPSNFRNDGEEGWWFPAIWLRDFAESRGVRSRPTLVGED